MKKGLVNQFVSTCTSSLTPGEDFYNKKNSIDLDNRLLIRLDDMYCFNQIKKIRGLVWNI